MARKALKISDSCNKDFIIVFPFLLCMHLIESAWIRCDKSNKNTLKSFIVIKFLYYIVLHCKKYVDFSFARILKRVYWNNTVVEDMPFSSIKNDRKRKNVPSLVILIKKDESLRCSYGLSNLICIMHFFIFFSSFLKRFYDFIVVSL